MNTRRTLWRLLAALPLANLIRPARAQDDAPGMELLTIFLRHDETMTLDEINRRLKKNGWFEHFPPADVDVVSWYVMMGIGQVVTLRFPADRLRDINRLVESEAWGAFSTEFYPTYDYRALYAQLQSDMK
jgi:hypothetical protein